MGRPVHFEITADDPERAVQFYESVFGWSIKRWGEGEPAYWLIDTGSGEPGINGGLMRREGGRAAGDTGPASWIVTVGVDDIEAAVAAVTTAGGEAGGKNQIPGVGWHAYCFDTEGNRFGVLQPDESMG